MRALTLVLVAAMAAGCREAPRPRAGRTEIVSARKDGFTLAAVKRGLREAAAGQDKAALRDLLWALDMAREDPTAVAAIATTVPEAIARLGLRYPPARVELLAREARMERAIIDADAVDRADVFLYLATTEASRRNKKKVVDTFVRVAERGQRASAARRVLYDILFDDLFEAGLFEHVVSDADLVVETLAFQHRRGPTTPPAWSARDSNRATNVFHAFLALGRHEDGLRFATQVLEIVPEASAYLLFIVAARAGGSDGVASALRKLASEKLPKGEVEELERMLRDTR